MSEFNLKIKSLFREYDVQVIDKFEEELKLYSPEKTILVIDQKIAKKYSSQLTTILPRFRTLIIKASEEEKTMERSLYFIDQLLQLHVKRNDVLVAIGGGIIQDITAFIASVLFRGIEWHFFPTTLLAQADSCIGSKSSINFGKYKNLIGTFCPPAKIFTDLQFLNTLSVGEIKSGIGEILHYYFVDGTNSATLLAEEYDSLFEDTSKLKKHLFKSLEIKKKMIEIDEFDTEKRHIFNYGHTFGHAIESITNYEIPHGQAISIGMDLANYISCKMGYLSDELFNKMHVILHKNMPHFVFNTGNMDVYLKALSKDKKNIENKLGCILTFGPGKMEKKYIALNETLSKWILAYSDAYLNA